MNLYDKSPFKIFYLHNRLNKDSFLYFLKILLFFITLYTTIILTCIFFIGGYDHATFI